MPDQRYLRLKAKYHKLESRLRRSLSLDSLSIRSLRKRRGQLRTIERYIRQLSRFSTMGLAAGFLAMGILPETLNGQSTTSFNFVPNDTPLGLTDIGYWSSPVFADIDADGDFDAFVGERHEGIKFFENTGSSSTPSFSLSSSTSPFGLTDIGSRSAPSFADIDGDGDLDAFVGELDGNINFFENTGSSSAPNFLLSSSLIPFGIADVGFDSNPAFADIDADGDLDVFIGEGDGYMNFFENTGSSLAPSFSLSSSTAPFGLTDIGLLSVPAFTDIDGDGDFDAFVGEWNGNINFFENTGSSSAPNFLFSTSLSPFGLTDVGYFSNPAFADIDADGDIDAFVGEEYGNIIFFAGAAGVPDFIMTPLTAGLSDVGDHSIHQFVDIDGDGDLDVFIGEYSGNINFFLNTGSITFPSWSLTSSGSPFGLTDIGFYSTPTFVDIDNDGDFDAFVGELNGNINFFENTGNSTNPIFVLSSSSEPFGLTENFTHSAPTFADLDGDGDLDAFVGIGYGATFYFENTGTPAAPGFMLKSTNPFGLTNVGFRPVPTFVDIDGDGDLDAFLGEGLGNTNFFENTGNSTSPAFSLSSSSVPFSNGNPLGGIIDIGGWSTPTFADIDSDGDFDAIVGEGDGYTNIFLNKPCKGSHVVNHVQINQDLFQSAGKISSAALIRPGRNVSFFSAQDLITTELGSIELLPGTVVSKNSSVSFETRFGDCID